MVKKYHFSGINNNTIICLTVNQKQFLTVGQIAIVSSARNIEIGFELAMIS